VPRERSVRLAGLSSPAKRGAAAPYRTRVSRAARRRLVVGILVVASLAMITAYFRESESGGAMHDVQDVAATALQPFETGANRLVAPFRDAWGYLSDLRGAKSEADRLRKENETLRAQSFQVTDAIQTLKELEDLTGYQRSARFPDDYTSLPAEVVSVPLDQFRQRIVIEAGYDDGIRKDYPVVVRAGLVGVVTKVTRGTAQVTLITDPQNHVTSLDQSTGAYGTIRGRGADKTLVFDRVPKAQSVREGHPVVTAGRRYLGLESLYPKNIGIGEVTSVIHLSTEDFKTIQVEPYVDFSSLQSVLVLIPKQPVSELPADDAP
jgi:rod shape-determining protein MreC